MFVFFKMSMFLYFLRFCFFHKLTRYEFRLIQTFRHLQETWEMTVKIMKLEWGRDINKSSSYLVIIEEKGKKCSVSIMIFRGLWDGSEIWNDNTIFDEKCHFLHTQYFYSVFSSVILKWPITPWLNWKRNSITQYIKLWLTTVLH